MERRAARPDAVPSCRMFPLPIEPGCPRVLFPPGLSDFTRERQSGTEKDGKARKGLRGSGGGADSPYSHFSRLKSGRMTAVPRLAAPRLTSTPYFAEYTVWAYGVAKPIAGSSASLGIVAQVFRSKE